ncbi:MAG: hypothetical protein NTU43_13205 [Bacteroidetes bacterium]|nr:hypothetical protein [Bacteroidota bacterium]
MLRLRPVSYITILLTLLYSSCKKFEKAPIPSYIYVKPYKLTTANNNSQGEASAKIVDAWIDVNGISIGSFGIPSTVPIIQTGKVKLTLKAGIINSGQDEQRIVYPFYTIDTFSINLQAERVDTVEGKVNYVNGLKFPFIEDFSFASNKFSIYGKKNQDSILIMNDNKGWKENNNYGKIQFSDSTTDVIELRMNTPDLHGFDLPAARSKVYFEIDYKSNVDFAIGMTKYLPGEGETGYAILQVSQKENWNKIYLDLTNEFIKLTSDYKFKISIGINKKTDGITDFNFDNLKLIYFE